MHARRTVRASALHEFVEQAAADAAAAVPRIDGEEQQLGFTWTLVRDELDQRLKHSPGVRAIRQELAERLLAGELTAPVAADRLLAAYDGLD